MSSLATRRMSDFFRQILMRRALVTSNTNLAQGFQLIELEGDTLKGVGWVPGEKIQVAIEGSFATRTYTPVEWNALAGRTKLLCYSHGEGPGSAWCIRARPGQECHLLGPRGSIDLSAKVGPIVLIGDETSIALAHALVVDEPEIPLTCLFEVNDLGAGQSVVGQLGIANTKTYQRRPDDAHLLRMEKDLSLVAGPGVNFVLTGKATTIQSLRRALQKLGIQSPQITAKAYWAPGKSGFD